jgi:hypothetical protein
MNQEDEEFERIEQEIKRKQDAAIARGQGRDWSLLEATQESLREHMAEIKRLKALLEQPTTKDSSEVDHGDELTIAYLDGVHTGKQLAKREWAGLTDDEQDEIAAYHGLDCMVYETAFRAIEAKLREKNGGAT